MRIKKFVFNYFAENTFIIWDEISREAAIIDPGCSVEEEENIIKDFILTEKLKPVYLLNTHCHIDHVLGNAFIKENYNLEFFAPKGDVFLLDLMQEHAESFGLTIKQSPKPDALLSESKKLFIGTIPIKFISTPGHTPDGYCFFFEKERICFTGDTLFQDSIGRTDLWGGDYDTIITSIKQKLLTLPDNIIIYPGHGDNSTIGYEKANNSFLV